MNPTYWKNKRVLVTGHTGFKGSWLSLWLQSLGAEVCGYALDPPTDPSMFELCNVGAGMKSIIGDVRDAEKVLQEVRDFGPEIVFHMAAQPLVRASYELSVETYSTNVMGTVHLLEAVRSVDTVRAVVIVTTDKCYENREWIWGYRESDALGGHDPYSNSKACTELVTSAYRDSFFGKETFDQHRVALASVRAGNVIGGGDWASDRLVPDTMRALLSGESVDIRFPQAVRPWQHVMEPLCGYMMVAEHLSGHGVEFAEPWNFGPPAEGAQPVSWVVGNLVKLWGGETAWRTTEGEHPHETSFLRLDSSKSQGRLGWKPLLDLNTSLEWVIEWFRSYPSKDGLHEVTLEQIQRYQKLAATSA